MDVHNDSFFNYRIPLSPPFSPSLHYEKNPAINNISPSHSPPTSPRRSPNYGSNVNNTYTYNSNLNSLSPRSHDTVRGEGAIPMNPPDSKIHSQIYWLVDELSKLKVEANLKIESLTQKLEETQSENQSLRNQIESLSSDVERFSKTVTTPPTSHLEQEILSLQDEVSSLRVSLKTLETSSNYHTRRLTSAVDSLEKRVTANQETNLSSLTSELLRLKREDMENAALFDLNRLDEIYRKMDYIENAISSNNEMVLRMNWVGKRKDKDDELHKSTATNEDNNLSEKFLRMDQKNLIDNLNQEMLIKMEGLRREFDTYTLRLEDSLRTDLSHKMKMKMLLLEETLRKQQDTCMNALQLGLGQLSVFREEYETSSKTFATRFNSFKEQMFKDLSKLRADFETSTNNSHRSTQNSISALDERIKRETSDLRNQMENVKVLCQESTFRKETRYISSTSSHMMNSPTKSTIEFAEMSQKVRDLEPYLSSKLEKTETNLLKLFNHQKEDTQQKIQSQQNQIRDLDVFLKSQKYDLEKVDMDVTNLSRKLDTCVGMVDEMEDEVANIKKKIEQGDNAFPHYLETYTNGNTTISSSGNNVISKRVNSSSSVNSKIFGTDNPEWQTDNGDNSFLNSL